METLMYLFRAAYNNFINYRSAGLISIYKMSQNSVKIDPEIIDLISRKDTETDRTRNKRIFSYLYN